MLDQILHLEDSVPVTIDDIRSEGILTINSVQRYASLLLINTTFKPIKL